MKELNQFILLRSLGKTVDEAGQCFVDAGMSPDYPEDIHKRLKHRKQYIPVVFSQLFSTDHLTDAVDNYAEIIYRILRLLKLDMSHPATSLNTACPCYRCNPVLFSRFNILLFPGNIPQTKFSLNTPCHDPP